MNSKAVLMPKIDKKGRVNKLFRMNVSLGKLESWVKDQVRHGDYSTDSEVVRDAVRRMKEGREAEAPDLQAMIDEAESSGFKKISAKDWKKLRDLARSGLGE